MCFAWCLLFATKWACVEMRLLSHEMRGRVVMAFALTTVAALVVFCLDKIDDTMKEANAKPVSNGGGADGGAQALAKEIIRIIVTSLGILVGFSWEHCFDGAVEHVSAVSEHM